MVVLLCINCLLVAKIKYHDQKKLKEESSCVSLYFQRYETPLKQGTETGTFKITSHPQTGNRKQSRCG